jgi:hypothetical protein
MWIIFSQPRCERLKATFDKRTKFRKLRRKFSDQLKPGNWLVSFTFHFQGGDFLSLTPHRKCYLGFMVKVV